VEAVVHLTVDILVVVAVLEALERAHYLYLQRFHTQ
jgi:hypothetical protein